MTYLVFGATSMVGELICSNLLKQREQVVTVSRRSGAASIMADLSNQGTVSALEPVQTIICAAPAVVLAPAINAVLSKCRPERLIVLSSTSVSTKRDSDSAADRLLATRLANAERHIVDWCRSENTEWTILRPTLIYREGLDNNVSQIARLVSRLGFMPLYGSASGLRQPVHADDLARGAIAAASSPEAANKVYTVSGLETISYREMAGRVFDGLSRKRRLVSLPPFLWKGAFSIVKPIFPKVTVAMGERMLVDMAFDSSSAVHDFGWSPRSFAPSFLDPRSD